MAEKGKSDRGVRTEESGVDETIPVTDATAGDEGIDEGPGDKQFEPGKAETTRKTVADSNDLDPESMGTDLAEGPAVRTSTSPGAPSKVRSKVH
jgi:hypothetical protein